MIKLFNYYTLVVTQTTLSYLERREPPNLTFFFPLTSDSWIRCKRQVSNSSRMLQVKCTGVLINP